MNDAAGTDPAPPAVPPLPLGGAVEEVRDDVLGNHLLDARGLQWLHGVNGDPYARALCGQDDDPYPLYERVREHGPVHRSLTGSLVVAGRSAAERVLGDGAVFARPGRGGPVPEPQVLPFLARDPLAGPEPGAAEEEAEGPAGSGGAAARAAREAVLERVAALRGRGGPVRLDVMADAVWPAAVAAAAARCGVPAGGLGAFAAACRALSGLPDYPLSAQRPQQVRALAAALEELDGVPGARPAEAARAAVAAHLAGNTVLALLGGPGAWKRVHGEPGLAAAAVGEALRLDPPVQMAARVARAGTEVGGAEVPAGAHVVVLVGAAGRDPGAYHAPGAFDPDRSDGGAGAAGRVVPPAVRGDAEAAVAALAEALPGLAPAGPVLYRRRRPVSRGPLALPASA
ncbi:cytochrome P450 family protein [Nocardiopsis potens]|uniref:cytochrome P450 family protein n=1 Tax=Nocardiopsis potens TaxID=1246458 RepID=UPI00034DF4D3|nr:P450-derived glycosyltransferase activator [Nocardiopsis potens]